MPVRYESIIGLSLYDRRSTAGLRIQYGGSHLDKG